MSYPNDVRYTNEHEWARLEHGVVTVGITSYATEQLGDVVFVELPNVGQALQASKPFGVVEAVKTVSDLFAPISGEVVEVNTALDASPEVVNEKPYEAWFFKVRPTAALESELATLMSATEYDKFVATAIH